MRTLHRRRTAPARPPLPHARTPPRRQPHGCDRPVRNHTALYLAQTRTTLYFTKSLNDLYGNTNSGNQWDPNPGEIFLPGRT